MFSVFEVKKEISVCIASRYCYAQTLSQCDYEPQEGG
jgi:hypothetical protein